MSKGENVGSVFFEIHGDNSAFKSAIKESTLSSQKAFLTAGKNMESAYRTAAQNSVHAVETSNKSLKSQAASLAAIYRKQGLSASEAFKKAWSEIERTARNTGEKSGKKFNSAFTKEIKSTASGVQSTFGSAMKAVGKSIGVAFSVGAVVSFGKKCVQVASETQSAWTGLSSIINGQGKDFNRAQGFIKSYVKDGLVPLNNAVTAYKNLSARGYDQSQIERVMLALKDSAAFGRQASLSYGDAIQSATEGLKNENSVLVDNAGVTKNVAKMWEDYAKSIGVTTAALTQQQKIQAEVNGIIQETRWQVGDAAKYASDFAGKWARITATVTRVKTAIGNMLIPVLNQCLPLLQTGLDLALSFCNAMQSVMASLGWEMPDVSAFNTAIGSVSTDAVNAAAATEGIGTAAETAAKKTKRAFASFDEINVLNTQKESVGANVGTGSIPNITSSTFSVTPVPTSAFDTAELESQLANIMTIVSAASLAIGAVLCFTGASVPLGIGLMVAGASGLAASIAIRWDSIKSSVSGVVSTITTIISTAALAVGAVLAFTGANIPVGIALMAVGAGTLVASEAPNWNSISDKTKETISKVTGIVGTAMLALGVLLLFTGGGTALGLGLIAAGATSLAAAIAPNWGAITQKVSEICSKIASTASNLWQNIKDTFANVGSWFSQKFTSARTSVENAFSSIGNFFGNIWTTIQSKFTSIGTKIGDAVGGAFKKAINAVLATVENVVNTPIRAINALAGVINAIPGINLGRLNEFRLPRLAQGGWVAANNPQLAIIGDNTREGEIVTPESKIREQVEAALAKMGGMVQKVKLELELLIRYPDGRTIIKRINEAQIAEGRILLEV